MRRGNIVTFPKDPTLREHVVIDVKYSTTGEAMVLVAAPNRMSWWTRATNCEKVLDKR